VRLAEILTLIKEKSPRGARLALGGASDRGHDAGTEH
jgi:hypothetical protein